MIGNLFDELIQFRAHAAIIFQASTAIIRLTYLVTHVSTM